MNVKKMILNIMPQSVIDIVIYKKFLSDEAYLKYRYKKVFGKKLDLKNPQTFNEKLQWLKLHDRNPEYTKMVDKYEAKKYVANIIGEEYIIPTLGVWNKFDEINFDSLPDQFVLKTTHDSGTVVICKDKKTFDIKQAKKTLSKALKRNFYLCGREWPYKNVKPRIIAEKYFVDESGVELKDYKVFSFGGQPKLIQVDFNRFVNHKRNIYSINWEFMDFSILYPNDKNVSIPKPVCLNEMLNIAKSISKKMNFVRVDFYVILEKIYFGEVTFYHGSGNEKFTPEEWDKTLGDWIKLPPKL